MNIQSFKECKFSLSCAPATSLRVIMEGETVRPQFMAKSKVCLDSLKAFKFSNVKINIATLFDITLGG